MKPLIIYHADCTDGFGAAFAAWLKFGDDAEYLPMNYGQNMPLEKIIDREVFVLDFSFAKPAMDILFAEATRVIWLDHHKTAFEMWCGEPPNEKFQRYYEPNLAVQKVNGIIELNNNKSGALLAWEYFYPETVVPLFIAMIDDRDRWQFNIDGSKEFHAALASYKPWSFDQWHTILDVTDNIAADQMVDEGWAILRAQNADVHSMAKQARVCKICVTVSRNGPNTTQHDVADGYIRKFTGLAVNANIHMSELGHELANQSGTYGMIYYVGADNKVKISLRSNGDYDVSTIAREFKGGGHMNAAGFETNIVTLMGFLA